MWPLGAIGESQANAHRNFRLMSPLPAGRHKLVSVAIAHCRLTITSQTKLHLCGVSKSMLTFACQFAENELLSQTADDMQTHVYPKSLEYMPGRTRRTGVVSGRNGISN